MIIQKKISPLYIIKGVIVDFMIVFVLGLSVYLFKIYFHQALPAFPIGISAFLGTAISILLSFKIGQSYDRWWEARKIWGAIVNDSRSFVIQLQAFLKDDATKSIQTMAYRQIAWCYSLGQGLRGLDPLENMGKYLSPEDINEIKKHSNKPLAILKQNAMDIKALCDNNDLGVYARVQLDSTLTRLTASMGKAERIKSTVFPTTYRLNLHISIYVFLVCLTITLTDVAIYYGLPLVLVIGTIFFMLEGAAYNLQDPFENRPSDTPVTAISRTIEINITDLLEEDNLPEPIASNGFYIL
jgi:putative membrane protein